MTTAERLRHLASRVRDEEGPAEDGLARTLDRAADHYEAGNPDDGRALLGEVARAVGDSWSTHSELGLEVLALSQALDRLS